MRIEWSLKTKTQKSCFWKEKITGDDSKKKDKMIERNTSFNKSLPIK